MVAGHLHWVRANRQNWEESERKIKPRPLICSDSARGRRQGEPSNNTALSINQGFRLIGSGLIWLICCIALFYFVSFRSARLDNLSRPIVVKSKVSGPIVPYV